MYIAPNGTIALMHNVPIDPGYGNTMFFLSKDEQSAWFESYLVATFTQQSYTRKDRNVVRIQIPVEHILDCNYMWFENILYGVNNKRFYCFIDKVEYVNNVTTDVFFTIDVIQTWITDWRLGECFVEREHTLSDNVGDNLVPETLETGEYICENVYTDGYTSSQGYCYVLAATFDKQMHDFNGSVYNGLYSGVCLNVFNTPEEINSFLTSADWRNKADGIVSLSIMPPAFISQTGLPVVVNVSRDKEYLNKRTNGNAPFNAKLQTAPYNQLYVTNLQGLSSTFPYEFFDSTNCRFALTMDFSPNPTAIMYPLDYKGTANNVDEKLSLTGFPQLPWNSDTFKAWLAQNAVSLAVNTASEIAGLAPAQSKYNAMLMNKRTVNFAESFGLSTLVNTFSAIGNTVATVAEHYFVPRQAHSGSGSVTLASNRLLSFVLMNKHIKPEFVDIIDDYFQMFGYACHKVKVPAIRARAKWSYVKTIGCQVGGPIPADHIAAIEQIFDNGIRFWTTQAEIGNYHVENTAFGGT